MGTQGSKLYTSIVNMDKRGIDVSEGGSMGFRTQDMILNLLKEWILWDLTPSSSTQSFIRFNPTSVPQFTDDVDPSMSVAKAFKGWNHYSPIIVASIEKYGSKETSDQDQNRRIQMMRRIRLRFEEILTEFDDKTDSEGITVNVATMRFKSFTVEQAKELWESIRMCFSMHGDLLLSLECPLNWPAEKGLQKGTRLFLDKPKVYDLSNATFIGGK